MRAMKLFLFFPACIVCILSCASAAKKNIQYVYITHNTKFVLLPTWEIEQAMDMAQFLSYEFRGQNYFLNAWVKANENAIEMAFFNELGVSIGELSYMDGIVHFSSAVFPSSVMQSFIPEYVIADFQLCFYDPFLLGRALKKSGLVLETNNGSRRILSGNEVIIEINKTGNTVRLVNHLRGYAYTLEGDFQ